MSSNPVQLGEKECSVVRLRLRKWLALEEIREEVNKAAENRNIDRFVQSVYSYISAAIDIPVEELEVLPSYEIIEAYSVILSTNVPKLDFPLLKAKVQEKKVAWDYEGRTWYLWSNVLSGKYGWTLEYMAELDVDDAIALFQEILVDEQLEREWQWSRSEIAYQLNPQTKKSEFKPLSRPNWMDAPVVYKPVKKGKIPKDLIPMGIVIRYEDDTPDAQ